MYVNGSSNDKGCGAGVVLAASRGTRFEYALCFNIRATNNESEYEALLVDPRVAKSLGVRHLLIYSDSQLVMNQTTEEYQTKDLKMEKYLAKVKS